MKADPKTEAAAMGVVKEWFEAFAKRDIKGVMAFFAPEPDVIAIGTGKDEKCVGPIEIKAILERAVAQFKEASLKFGWHSVSAIGSVALVATDVVLSMKTSDREITEHMRLTVALERRGNRWLIMQWHDSVPRLGRKTGKRSQHSAFWGAVPDFLFEKTVHIMLRNCTSPIHTSLCNALSAVSSVDIRGQCS